MKSLFLWVLILFPDLVFSKPDNTVYLPLKSVSKSLRIDRLMQVDDAYIVSSLAEGLFDIGEGFQMIPLLAESVAWKGNGKVLSLKIRAATFSDGSNVTANDVIKNLERCIGDMEESISSAFFSIVGYSDFKSKKARNLLGLKKISEHEVDIEMIDPSPLLADNLTFYNCSIVKSIKGNSLDLLDGAIGTGPYQIVSSSDKEIVIAKRSNYYRQINSPEKVVYRPTNHWGDFNKLKEWATLIEVEGEPGNHPEFRKFEHVPLASFQLVFNNSTPPFNKGDVREAVSRAIDFDILTKKMNWSPSYLQSGLFPYGMHGFEKRILKKDINLSNKLLSKHGFTKKHPLRFKILISKSKNTEKEVKIWEEVFSDTPIKVDVELVEQKELVKRREEGKYDAIRVTKMPGSIDGNRLLSSYLSNSKFNTARSNTPDCDEIILSSLKISDVEKRYSLYKKADRCLINHHILVPLSSVNSGYIMLKKPWMLLRKNRYNLKPYWLANWNESLEK